jgi:putative peptidoglycan lipid II flippase
VLTPLILPLVPRLNVAFRDRAMDRLLQLTHQAMLWSGGLIAVPIICLLAGGASLTAAVFERGAFTAADSRLVAELLVVYAFGAPGWVLLTVSLRVLWVLGQARHTAVVTLLGMLLYFPSGYWLSALFGVHGLAAGFSLYINLVGILLYLSTRRYLRETTCASAP